MVGGGGGTVLVIKNESAIRGYGPEPVNRKGVQRAGHRGTDSAANIRMRSCAAELRREQKNDEKKPSTDKRLED